MLLSNNLRAAAIRLFLFRHIRHTGCTGRCPSYVNIDSGFSLIEVMIVLVVLSVLATFVAPEVADWRPKQNLKAAAEQLFTDMQRARIIAIRDNSASVLTVSTAAPCTAGNYSFSNTVAPDPDISVCVSDTAADISISSNTIAAGEGFTQRGLTILGTGGGTITLVSNKLSESGDPYYTVTITGAGGVTLDKLVKP